MRLAFKRYDESKFSQLISLQLTLNYILAKEASSKPEAVRMMHERNLIPHYGHLNP